MREANNITRSTARVSPVVVDVATIESSEMQSYHVGWCVSDISPGFSNRAPRHWAKVRGNCHLAISGDGGKKAAE